MFSVKKKKKISAKHGHHVSLYVKFVFYQKNVLICPLGIGIQITLVLTQIVNLVLMNKEGTKVSVKNHGWWCFVFCKQQRGFIIKDDGNKDFGVG
jgi:hypothetical protein